MSGLYLGNCVEGLAGTEAASLAGGFRRGLARALPNHKKRGNRLLARRGPDRRQTVNVANRVSRGATLSRSKGSGSRFTKR